MRRRRRRQQAHGYDQGLSLQDLLSNALAAVILLTLIAAAITGTGREFIRSPESRGESPQPTEVTEWTTDPVRPDEPPKTLLVEIGFTLDGPDDRPLVAAAGTPDPERDPSVFYLAGRHHGYTLLLPASEGQGWTVDLEQASAVSALEIKVHAGAALVRQASWTQEIPACPEGTHILAICIGAQGLVQTDLPMSCAPPRPCN